MTLMVVAMPHEFFNIKLKGFSTCFFLLVGQIKHIAVYLSLIPSKIRKLWVYEHSINSFKI